MKKIILLLSVMIPSFVCGQVCFTFEGGSDEGWLYNTPGRWAADNVQPLKGSYSLHHVFDNTGSGSDLAFFNIMGLCLQCSDIRWKFSVRYGSDPSSSNRWHFFLTSDADVYTSSNTGEVKGFAVGVNLSGYDDTLRLWRLDNGIISRVITTGLNWQNDVGTNEMADITVIRKTTGEWEVSVSWSGNEMSWKGSENRIYPAAYSGISYIYTSTRDRLLWIDDVLVEGVFVPDTIAPSVKAVTAPAPDVLRALFDDDTDLSSVSPLSISINGRKAVSSIKPEGGSSLLLFIDTIIPNRQEAQIDFGEVCDLSGNCSETLAHKFTPVYADAGDVVISEIMPDPSPSVELPEEEYIEILNITGDSLSVMQWMIIADADTSFLPEMWIAAGEAVILCAHPDTSLFSGYGSAAGISSFPSLNDSGETISLRDRCGRLMHCVSYSPFYYYDELRSGGGWSLELTDTGHPFNEPHVWRASSDHSGGTPGRQNSLCSSVPDMTNPEVIASWVLQPDIVEVVFDESIFSGKTPGTWSIDNELAVNVNSGDICDRSMVITSKREFVKGRIYHLQVPEGVTDFAGNNPAQQIIAFGVPETPLAGDVSFNEILFNPLPGLADFIELYNNSDKVIDLSGLNLVSSGDGSSADVIRTAQIPRQLLPGGYVAVTTMKEALSEHYICSDRADILQVNSLPSMPDDKGAVSLYDRSMNLIDRVDYNDGMHMIFLSVTEGISLEKVNPGLPSQDKDNWHSASEACNWGSPGNINSVFVPDADNKEGLSLSSERVSPDGDGFEDVVSLQVTPGGEENVVSVSVFNERGYIVRSLARRFYAGHGALFIWDGTDDGGRLLPAGLYLVIAESYNPRGETRRWKKVCAVLYR